MTNIGRKRTKFQRTMTLGSQLLNVWLFDGSEDETVSGRAYREGMLGGNPVWAKRKKKIDKIFSKLPFIGEDDHCFKSHQIDVINSVVFQNLIPKEV